MNVTTRGTTAYPLLELYHRGELGISELENRRHWRDAQRFRALWSETEGEPCIDSAEADWQELTDFFATIDWHGLINDTDAEYGGLLETPADFSEPAPKVDDDGALQDTAIRAFQVVDNARWCVFRDLEPHGQTIQAKQTIALAAEMLGPDYRVLVAAICRGWNQGMLGATEGFPPDSATARACGKGLLRQALRKLSEFFLKLDRLERGDAPSAKMWPLVGTPVWMFTDAPDARWKRRAA